MRKVPEKHPAKKPGQKRFSVVKRVSQGLRAPESLLRPPADLFTEETAHRCGTLLSMLEKKDPTAATAVVLSLFLGLSRAEAASVLGVPQDESLLWDEARTNLREHMESVGTRRAGFSDLEQRQAYGEAHAFIALARNPKRNTLVVSPLGPNHKNDRKLARIVTGILREKPRTREALLGRLREFSCLISAANIKLDGMQDGAQEALRSLAVEDDKRLRSDFFPLGLTTVDVRDIQRDMDKMGRSPEKKHQKTEDTAADIPRHARMPRGSITVEEIEELLTKESTGSPAIVLSSFDSLVQELHRNRLGPDLQHFLDRVQAKVAKMPGNNLGSFSENKAFVDALRGILHRLDVRLDCPTCHRPSSLVMKQGSTLTGSFLFRHRASDLRTDHGGKTSLPPLRLTTESDTTQDD